MKSAKPFSTGVTILLLSQFAGACSGGDTPAVGEAEYDGSESITIWTDRVELFFEHPAMVAGVEGGPWAIHLTDLSDFRAVTEGRLTLRFEGPDGQVHSAVADAPARPGVYSPAPTLPQAGMYDLVVVLEGARVSDEIFVGPIQVWASATEIPRLEEEEAVGIGFLKEQQWPIDFATAPAAPRVVSSGIEVTGRILAAPGRVAEMTAPVEGIVRFDLNRDSPPEGAWVTVGQPLARLSPSGGDGAFAPLKALAERLERDVARLERLAAVEAVPARRLEEARYSLEVVQAQLGAMDPGSDDGYTLTVSAPFSGAVTRRSFTAGQRVEAGALLFTLLDPRVVHLRLDVPVAEAAAMGLITGATFSPEGSGTVLRATQLVGVGAALDPESRTVPATFEVGNARSLLKPGMLVKARLLTGEPEPALAVPASAIVDEDGLVVAYVQIGGETFERRAVTVGASDGEWTTLLSGVRPGERVVIRGQYQIKLSSLNTSEISDHGHPH